MEEKEIKATQEKKSPKLGVYESPSGIRISPKKSPVRTVRTIATTSKPKRETKRVISEEEIPEEVYRESLGLPPLPKGKEKTLVIPVSSIVPETKEETEEEITFPDVSGVEESEDSFYLGKILPFFNKVLDRQVICNTDDWDYIFVEVYETDVSSIRLPSTFIEERIFCNDKYYVTLIVITNEKFERAVAALIADTKEQNYIILPYGIRYGKKTYKSDMDIDIDLIVKRFMPKEYEDVTSKKLLSVLKKAGKFPDVPRYVEIAFLTHMIILNHDFTQGSVATRVDEMGELEEFLESYTDLINNTIPSVENVSRL